LNHEHNDGDDQKDMNDATHRVATHQGQKPQNEENHTYGPKHAYSPFPLISCKPDGLPLSVLYSCLGRFLSIPNVDVRPVMFKSLLPGVRTSFWLALGISFSRNTGSPTASVGIFGSGHGLMVLIINGFGILSMFSTLLNVVRRYQGHDTCLFISKNRSFSHLFFVVAKVTMSRPIRR
jgi:hypothetical protein